MIIFLIWLLGSLGVSFLAGSFNRSKSLWFFFSLFLSPIVGLILLLIFGSDGKKCPKCAEVVKPDALICKHCSHAFDLQKEIKEEDKPGFYGW